MDLGSAEAAGRWSSLCPGERSTPTEAAHCRLCRHLSTKLLERFIPGATAVAAQTNDAPRRVSLSWRVAQERLLRKILSEHQALESLTAEGFRPLHVGCLSRFRAWAGFFEAAAMTDALNTLKALARRLSPRPFGGVFP